MVEECLGEKGDRAQHQPLLLRLRRCYPPVEPVARDSRARHRMGKCGAIGEKSRTTAGRDVAARQRAWIDVERKEQSRAGAWGKIWCIPHLRSSSDRNGNTACSKASTHTDGGMGGSSASRSARWMATRAASLEASRGSRQRAHIPRSTRNQSALHAGVGPAAAAGCADARNRACVWSSKPTARSHWEGEGAACAFSNRSAESVLNEEVPQPPSPCTEWPRRDARASVPARDADSSDPSMGAAATPAARRVSASHESEEVRPAAPPACNKPISSAPMAAAARGDSLGSETAGGTGRMSAAASGSAGAIATIASLVIPGGNSARSKAIDSTAADRWRRRRASRRRACVVCSAASKWSDAEAAAEARCEGMGAGPEVAASAAETHGATHGQSTSKRSRLRMTTPSNNSTDTAS
eukprot:scaffold109965_cov28-Tisochrysis_lutea.AAC.4